MKSLDIWLYQKPGSASRLAEQLAIDRSYLSQVRKGTRKIPVDWMPVIDAFTSGAISIESMVLAQAKGKVKVRRERREAA